ncbi:MAG: hypothetical protein V4723_07335 [Pseudomonadota bacterium]
MSQIRSVLATPLGVILSFVGVCEAIGGATLSTSSWVAQNGTVQIILAAFMAVFPLTVACGFFAVIWFRPTHLLTQPNFASAAEGVMYIEALKGSAKRAIELETEMVATAEQMKAMSAHTKIAFDGMVDLQTQLNEQAKALDFSQRSSGLAKAVAMSAL